MKAIPARSIETDPFTAPSDLEPEVDPNEPRMTKDNKRVYIKCPHTGPDHEKCPEGKEHLYTRATTFIDCLGDKSTLEKWRQRVILIGLSREPALRLDLHEIDPDDRDMLNSIAEQAFEAGDGYLKARRGTNMHRLTEQWDRGEPVDPFDSPEQEAAFKSYLRIYEHLDIEPVLIEQRIVNDELGVTGTFDRVARYRCLDGRVRYVVVDLKTGTIDMEPGKNAQQLALYASGQLYVHATGERVALQWDNLMTNETETVSREVGLVIQVDQETAALRVVEVNLTLGWAGIGLSRQVRDWRNFSKKVYHEVPL